MTPEQERAKLAIEVAGIQRRGKSEVLGTVTGRLSDAGNPRPLKELEPRRAFPEPPIGTDYAAELAGADYAATEARFMAHYAGLDDWYSKTIKRTYRPFRTRKQRRIAAQLKRVRPLLGVGPEWRIGKKGHHG